MSQVHLTVDQYKALSAPRKRTGSKLADARDKFSVALPQQSDAERQAQRGLFELHNAAVWTIRLPLPPTMNLYWRSIVRPGSKNATVILSAEGREYKEAVKRAWLAKWNGWPPEPLSGRLRLLLAVAFISNPPPDLDNRVKPLQDALKDAGAYQNDNQIDDLRVIRIAGVHRPGWIDVTIETITSEGA